MDRCARQNGDAPTDGDEDIRHKAEFVHTEFQRSHRRGLELLTDINPAAKSAFFELLSPEERVKLVDCLLYYIEEAPRPTLDLLAQTDGQTKSDFHARLPENPIAREIFFATANVREATTLIWLTIEDDYDKGVKMLRYCDDRVCRLILDAFAQHPDNYKAFLALTQLNYPDIYARLEIFLQKFLPPGKAQPAPSKPNN